MLGRCSPLLVAGTLAASLLAASARGQDVKIDSDTFGGLEARSIGPAAMSGRVAALDGVAGDRLTLYVGAAGGGLWKSDDGGLVFKPVFDKHAQSIGAVAVDPSDPNVVWVGTGETWVRNSVSLGDGVYRSGDGGESWQKLGLEASERIARIAVHPKDSKTVFVCALGRAFADGEERGVYRTRDAGASWEKVLYVAPNAGCADLALDPADPAIVYAAMWQYRREPWFFTSGGPGSGFYRSTDGGGTWQAVRAGLPAGELGRIAIAPSPAKAGRVYATVEARKTALYRSEDHGQSWTEVNSSSAVTGRPFYFSLLVADPQTADRVYKPGFGVAVSDDAGATFSGLGGGGMLGPSFHGDVHALWVNPRNPEQLVIGTDGGVYVSADRGRHWRFVGSLPLSQFYHVSYDMQWPYWVYGGLQDNSTWYGPSRRAGLITNKHWESAIPGDGFWAFPDPTDPDVLYGEYQGGRLFRVNKSTQATKDIRPSPKRGEPKFRFNWNTPIHMSRSQPGTLYYGAQFLFRSRDQGDTWERLSPDLTTNDPAKQRQVDSGGLTPDNSTAENYCTIFAIAESPLDGNVIWVGTDDGNVQLTRDGGKTWTNLTAKAGGPPQGLWVTSIEASPHDAATAFVTLDGHMQGDFETYVYRTRDYGATWESLATPALQWYAHVVKQDPVNPSLLFLGTEWGLYVSLDGGAQWAQFTAGLPNVAVRDLAIHPRDHDLIVASHGRGIFILDDLTPLRALTPEVLAADAAFLPSRPAAMSTFALDFGFSGDGDYPGRSPEEAAFITYYLKRRHLLGDLRLEVYDAEGRLITTLPASKRRGVNRVGWPMRLPPPPLPAGADLVWQALWGPRVPEGRYEVKLVRGKETLASTVELVPDPRWTHSAEDRALQRETAQKLYDLLGQLTFVVERTVDARDAARARAAALDAKSGLRQKLEAFAEALDTQRATLVSTSRGEGISGDEKLREELGVLYGYVNLYDGRPTTSQLDRLALLQADLEAAAQRFEATTAKELPKLNAGLTKAGAEPIAPLTEEAWQARRPH